MIPLKDSIPNVYPPVAVWAVLIANTLAFLFEQSLDPRAYYNFMHLFGVIPARYLNIPLGEVTGSLFWDGLPFLSHMFLHSGWSHFLLNMWSLWIFADNVEDVMGPLRFVVFYLVCGLCAVAAHIFFHPASQVPVVGASGAIAGVMGAYFVLYPHGRVLTFIPVFILPWIIEVPSVLFLGMWFVLQFLSGMADTAVGGSGAGIAFWAHAGGFVAGVALIPLFRVSRRCHYCYSKPARRYVRHL